MRAWSRPHGANNGSRPKPYGIDLSTASRLALWFDLRLPFSFVDSVAPVITGDPSVPGSVPSGQQVDHSGTDPGARPSKQPDGRVPVPSGQQVDQEAAARRAFSTSMLVSATRCLLTYIVLPFVAPALGMAAEVGPGLGIVIGLVAIASNLLTIRRFHAARHRWRWGYTAIAVSVIGLLGVLMVRDVLDLIG